MKVLSFYRWETKVQSHSRIVWPGSGGEDSQTLDFLSPLTSGLSLMLWLLAHWQWGRQEERQS